MGLACEVFGLQSLYLVLVVLVLGCQVAQAADHWPLRNLSSGSELTVVQPILIRANNSQEPIMAIQAGSSIRCSIRMVEAEGHDRVIPPRSTLEVTGIKRAAVTSRNTIQTWTSVLIDSDVIDDVLCTSPPNQHDLSIGDFRAAVRSSFRLKSAAPQILEPEQDQEQKQD